MTRLLNDNKTVIHSRASGNGHNSALQLLKPIQSSKRILLLASLFELPSPTNCVVLIHLWFMIFKLALLALCATTFGLEVTHSLSSRDARTRVSLLGNTWLHARNSSVAYAQVLAIGNLSTLSQQLSTLSTPTWTRVRLPHSWNERDGQSGGEFERAAFWYATTVRVVPGMQTIIDIGAASMSADVYVNGLWCGSHRGGFSRFRIDVSRAVPDGAPVTALAILVNNELSLTDILPQRGDFTIFGGLFRDVSVLFIKPNTPVFNAFDFGSPGIKFMQTNALSRARPSVAEFNTVISVGCSGGLLDKEEDRHFNVKVQVYYGAGAGATGRRVVSRNARLTMNFNCTIPSIFTIPFTMRKPRLWDGRIDPFLYNASVVILYKGRIVDTYSSAIGVRSYWLDPEMGFFLNGRPYSLYGVNLHQDWLNLGWAISPRHTLQNIKMMDELNITALRCAHYQHSDYTYQLADRYGFVVWAEIPNLEVSPADPLLYANAASQLSELIRQSYNHPSILFWSLGNELAVIGEDTHPTPMVWALQRLAKLEDPYRLTTMAINTQDLLHPMLRIPDSVAINVYYGWYGNGTTPNMTGTSLDLYHADDRRIPLGIAEYGAGASIQFHSENPVRMDHTEEYQAWFHEQTWPQLRARRWMWWKSVWNFADFASFRKDEGDAPGRNDKGLVTFDRGVRKDAFYYYKAVWSQGPFVHVCSGRFKVRERVVNVKVYASGVRELVLSVNGVSAGERMALREDRVHVWKGVVLQEGVNDIVVSSDIRGIFGSATWRRGGATDLALVHQES
ncbi:glycoside hydrolase superfamily [Chytriomyces sp. MP71]|nr:glycoside hydrolase superfamily [Chytriomyces sp. MP71]